MLTHSGGLIKMNQPRIKQSIGNLATRLPTWIAEWVLMDKSATRSERLEAVETLLATEVLVAYGMVLR